MRVISSTKRRLYTTVPPGYDIHTHRYSYARTQKCARVLPYTHTLLLASRGRLFLHRRYYELLGKEWIVVAEDELNLAD